MLAEKDKAPLQIALMGSNGKSTKLSDFKGKYIAIYFYPKNFTPGCTTEACEFRDYYKDIKKLNVEIIGISTNDKSSHKKFIEKHNLNFTLLADTNHQLSEAFGTWQPKKMFGKEFFGIKRSTFIIDPTGVIVKVWKNVKVAGHAKAVFEYLKENIDNTSA